MCLILIAYGVHPDFPLVVAANRDEFHLRPTAAAAFWQEAPQVLAGRDLQEGGSWLGITLTGRFAAVTNYRDLTAVQPGRRSRGMLVGDFLTGSGTPGAYLVELSGQSGRYNDFNLLCGLLPDQLWWYSNRGGPPVPLGPGVFGLSNGLLDTPWPKVVRGKAGMEAAMADPGSDLVGRLLRLLADRTVPPDRFLPDTGVGLARERLLAPSFIVSPAYGTRCSTILILDRQRSVTFVEQGFAPTGEPTGTATFRFALGGDDAG